MPDPLFEVFDNVMREEANHIVFFINWYAHHQAKLGTSGRLLRIPLSLWHYAKALGAIADLVRGDDGDDGADFIVTGAKAFVDELTPSLVIEACLAENERRLAHFDRRLLVPRLIPSLARAALAGLKLIPSRGSGPELPTGTSEDDSASSKSQHDDQTSHAA